LSPLVAVVVVIIPAPVKNYEKAKEPRREKKIDK
jgi:hypothetical protein